MTGVMFLAAEKKQKKPLDCFKKLPACESAQHDAMDDKMCTFVSLILVDWKECRRER